MDVFALRGPEFLVLFAGLAAVVYFVVDALITAREARLPASPRIRDPYVIAYLRGETRELIRVVALSLNLRGLLAIGKTTFHTLNETEIERAQLPIEKEILRLCRTFCAPPALAVAPGIESIVAVYRNELIERGLLAADTVKRERWPLLLTGGAILLLVAVTKISVALATGHRNIVLLVVLAFAAVLLLKQRAAVRTTPAGRAALRDLANLFRSLRSRRFASSPDTVAETMLLASVFGTYGVPELHPKSWRRLFPDPSSNSSGSGGCGGGGCGGGGGGCGGCGS